MIKKGTKVKVLAGKDKFKVINIIKKHEKTTKEKKGGIISKENFIHISNLSILNEKKTNPKKIINKDAKA